MSHPITMREYWAGVGIRAVKTVAQTAVALIGTGFVAWGEVPWVLVASTALVSGLVSILMSLASLPDPKDVGEEKPPPVIGEGISIPPRPSLEPLEAAEQDTGGVLSDPPVGSAEIQEYWAYQPKHAEPRED